MCFTQLDPTLENPGNDQPFVALISKRSSTGEENWLSICGHMAGGHGLHLDPGCLGWEQLRGLAAQDFV